MCINLDQRLCNQESTHAGPVHQVDRNSSNDSHLVGYDVPEDMNLSSTIKRTSPISYNFQTFLRNRNHAYPPCCKCPVVSYNTKDVKYRHKRRRIPSLVSYNI